VKIHKILCILLCATFIFAPIITLAEGEYTMNDSKFYKSLAKSESEYIQKVMLSNGALPMNPVSVTNDFASKDLPDINGIPDETYKTWKCGKIMPYFSESAILGILEAAPETSKETVEKFINWYFDNLNTAETDLYGVDGTIYDYYVFVDPNDSSKIVQISLHEMHKDEYPNQKDNPNDYDSTDSYAALFVRILYDYYQTYGESDLFVDRKADVDRVLNALFSTYVDKIDLTYAKPSYKVCYLMDNCEVYNGLVAAAALYDAVYNDQTKSAELAEYADKVDAALEKYMWDEKAGAYYYGIFADGKSIDEVTPENLQQFYPHATAQLFPIMFGLLDDNADRATMIYEKFNSNFGQKGVAGKDWAVIDKSDVYPWCTIARAAVAVGDYERTDRFLETLKNKFIMQAHKYPYYTGEAGQALIAINAMLTPVELLGVENEVLTADVGDEIELGALLFPESADAGRLNISIKDNTIVEFDKSDAKLKALKAGQTEITLTLNETSFDIVLNVKDTTATSGTASEVSNGKSKNDNKNTLYAVIAGIGAAVIGTIAVITFKKSKKKK